MEALSNKTELNDRTLWFDGDSTVNHEEITRLVAAGLPTDHLFVKQLTDDIQKFNRSVPKQQQIGIKQSSRQYSLEWNLPDEYANIDVMDYLLDQIEKYATSYGYDVVDDDIENSEKIPRHIIERITRCAYEMRLYYELEMQNVLRALIYIINTLRANDVVWGVGRGSSVSSYVLYLIGVHDVDSVEYQLDIHDFLPTIGDNSNNNGDQ